MGVAAQIGVFMRLNGWQKLGAALSIIWGVAAALYSHGEDVKGAESFAKLSYGVCSNAKMLAEDADLSSCEAAKAKNVETWLKDSSSNAAVTALAPIPLGWLVGFILLYLWRIQRAGFRLVVPWGDLSKPKKSFVIFCFFTSGGILLFVSVMVMNLYLDTKVPVNLSPFLDVTQTGDRVDVSGTWTRHGALAGREGDGMGVPLQTSKITCYRAERRCTEARASVSGNTLNSELVEYDLVSWTKDSIVLKSTDMCHEDIFTIDLNTKAVTGAGRRINGETTFCNMYPQGSGESEWRFRLESGFPIYWDIRSKARPWVLRVIQPFFGN